jgi:polyhydroxyalkanoate synthesis regulator phasin
MLRFPVSPSRFAPKMQLARTQTVPHDKMYFASRVSPAFDTHDLVKRLVASGFTSQQAEVVLESMKQAAEQYANTADSMYPTKIEMIEKNLAYKADFASMKSDLVLMLKQDVALLKNEIHKVFPIQFDISAVK